MLSNIRSIDIYIYIYILTRKIKLLLELDQILSSICNKLINIFFFYREFQPMSSAPNDIFYHQTKTPIGIWYRRGLNPKSLIQP